MGQPGSTFAQLLLASLVLFCFSAFLRIFCGHDVTRAADQTGTVGRSSIPTAGRHSERLEVPVGLKSANGFHNNRQQSDVPDPI